MDSKRPKLAVVLFNLGGPDRLESIRPFLFNLFSDPAIFRVPQPFRTLLAWVVSKKRSYKVAESYALMGGKSPLLDNTRKQAEALEKDLRNKMPEHDVKVFISMRYWHPMSFETAQDVRDFNPNKIVALPLYPQWSTTTTASSWKDWKTSSVHVGLTCPMTLICCYPFQKGFIQSSADLIMPHYAEAKKYGMPRILFSAHGLPEKVVKSGDPYQWQCEQTAEAIVKKLNIESLDWALCYQSRVGPLKWIGPSTEQEIDRAAKDRAPLVIYPLAFVSEHIETEVEINREYRHRAEQSGVPFFSTVPTVGTAPEFIGGMADMVAQASAASCDKISGATDDGQRACPQKYRGCALA